MARHIKSSREVVPKIDLRKDVNKKLLEKGYIADKQSIEDTTQRFEEALIKIGYWSLLEEVIDTADDLQKPQFTLDNLEVGKEYKLLAIPSLMKKTLHNKRVVVDEVKKDYAFPVTVTVLEGGLKGTQLHIPVECLQ